MGGSTHLGFHASRTADRRQTLRLASSMGGVVADFPAYEGCGHRLRRPEIPDPPRLRSRIDQRRTGRSRTRPTCAWRQHHLTAGGEEFVSMAGTKLDPQRPGGLLHGVDRNAVAKATHSGGVFKRRRVWSRSVRCRRGVGNILPQTSRATECVRLGVASGGAAEPKTHASAIAVGLRTVATAVDHATDAQPGRNRAAQANGIGAGPTAAEESQSEGLAAANDLLIDRA